MSIPVDLAALPDEIARFGASALLVTTSADGPPHVASVLVSVEGDELAMPAGRTTLRNADTRPAVALVWSAPGEYCLIVDATARDAGPETLRVQPTSAVLHRLASATT